MSRTTLRNARARAWLLGFIAAIAALGAARADDTEVFLNQGAARGIRPNVLFVALIGWKAAGIPGACTAIGAICAPSSVLTLVVARFLERFREARWRIAAQAALAPITAGLMIAAAILRMRPGGQGGHGWVLSLLVVAGSLRYKVNPLWFIGLGAVAGATLF